MISSVRLTYIGGSSVHPRWYRMLLDKSVAVNVDGLNPMLAVETDGRQGTVTVDPAFDIYQIWPPILRRIPVATEVQILLDHPLEVHGLPTPFSGFVDGHPGSWVPAHRFRCV